MRIFAIPIVKNRLVYYCHSTLPTTSRLTKLVHWSNKKWDELGNAKEDTWKKKLHDKGNDMMNRLDYQEWFLKGIPTKEHIEKLPGKVIAYHPSDVTADDVEHNLKLILDKHLPYHQKYMKYSAYWVPVSCTFVVVPLIPNIPLAYNLFRLYSHYKAYKGAQYLEHLIDDGILQYQTSLDIDNYVHGDYLAHPEAIVFPDNLIKTFKTTSKLDLHMFDGDLPGVLNKQAIADLAQKCQTPSLELELLRARKQILATIFLSQHQIKK
ncbi:mitochondrial K+-H+ exchange-related-domain-containing protein [Halteromyces radiatus]|uniref:mitochondrial K+-H+ exchange-related-domain-containing protein n=1 Tax=Halteromyces radiatus TaxID=101107 RepID=UPI00221F8398|nr:mitochondrial K+-H+ exchange-related-domain-containing protein [Halteromyces radiatus]KAI8089100.1 mitochondrial K+-H+ exchange-related-domain-containing protein [Halteromyces radiatus]